MRRYPGSLATIGWPLGVLAGAWAVWAALGVVREEPLAPPAVAVSAPAIRAERLVAVASVAPVGIARPATAPVPAAPAIDAEPTRAEVCGYGIVERAPDDPDLLQRLPLGVRRAALEAVDARMLASPDPQVRAAALLIGARARHDGAGRIARLARLAVGSQDAVVYAMALEGCAGWPAADCALLSRAQWVRLAPSHLQPWLALAAEARGYHDGDAEAEAMRGAAAAAHSDAPAALLPSLVDRALGDDTPALQRTLALSLAWSVQVAWRASYSEQAFAWCGDDAARVDRSDTCAALAQALADRGTSAADLGIGLAIARRLPDAVPGLQALQQENDAINEAGAFSEVGVDWSCDAVERLQQSVRQLAAGGERQVLRHQLARSGRSVEDWSAEHRRNVALAAATATAATLATEAEPAR